VVIFVSPKMKTLAAILGWLEARWPSLSNNTPFPRYLPRMRSCIANSQTILYVTATCQSHKKYGMRLDMSIHLQVPSRLQFDIPACLAMSIIWAVSFSTLRHVPPVPHRDRHVGG
jgi:hypothetical protein